MKSPEIERKVKSIKKRAEKIVNEGVGKGPFDLEKTLENHLLLKNLLEKMEYVLQKDISEEDVLTEISNIEKEIKLIQKDVQ